MITELRKQLVLELNSKKPCNLKISKLKKQIEDLEVAASKIEILTFNAVYGQPEEMQNCLNKPAK